VFWRLADRLGRSKPVIGARTLLLVMPVTVNSRAAMAVGLEPEPGGRRTVVRTPSPSAMTVGLVTCSITGLMSGVPWPAVSLQQSGG